MQFVKHPAIDLFVAVLLDGLATPISNAFNVRAWLKFKIFFELPSSIYFISTDECQVDDDCPLSKECANNECQNPCNQVICGTRAECRAEFHKGVCYCSPGLQGNPLVSCTEVGCTSNDDCRDNEKCDFSSTSSSKRECQPLCIGQACAQFATCTAQNHRELCTCDPPYDGDGYISCYIRKHDTLYEKWPVDSIKGIISIFSKETRRARV